MQGETPTYTVHKYVNVVTEGIFSVAHIRLQKIFHSFYVREVHSSFLIREKVRLVLGLKIKVWLIFKSSMCPILMKSDKIPLPPILLLTHENIIVKYMTGNLIEWLVLASGFVQEQICRHKQAPR